MAAGPQVPRPDPDDAPDRISRRSFLVGAGGVAAGGVIAGRAEAETGPAKATPGPARPETLEGTVEIELALNGEAVQVAVEPRTTLLSALRDRMEPPRTGTKLVCDRGNCGACTVLLDGQPVYACLTLAVAAAGREVRTVEGLATGGELTPVQKAMLRHDGMMCGFCTPGFVMSLTATLERDPGASLDEIKRGCAGNLCRCGTYPHVFEAALEAGREMGRGR